MENFAKEVNNHDSFLFKGHSACWYVIWTIQEKNLITYKLWQLPWAVNYFELQNNLRARKLIFIAYFRHQASTPLSPPNVQDPPGPQCPWLSRDTLQWSTTTQGRQLVYLSLTPSHQYFIFTTCFIFHI